ncbi:MAG: DUF1501 domain-containing protein, partial [Gemmataceae bacterium]|nr:DUF1501 domain-containing protein [Gemmataceae bacterium]
MDEWTRRQFVRGVGFGAMGLGLPGLLRARPARAKAKACILVFLFGGPSHVDTWDMKPDAPAEYRSEFKPVATSQPGVRVCEHLPRTARLMHRVNVVRSVTMMGLGLGD